jgi:hypothetical protein
VAPSGWLGIVDGMTDAAPPPAADSPATPLPATPARRHAGAAAVAALGVYLVIALSRVIETLFYVLGSYWQDALGYLRLMLPGVAPEWFLAPLPFALMVWLGFAVIFPIRATLPTRAVIVRSVLTTVVGILVAALFAAVGAYVTMYAAAIAYGAPTTASIDEVLLRFPGLVNSAVSAMATLITTGTLATVSAGLLLREHLRRDR